MRDTRAIRNRTVAVSGVAAIVAASVFGLATCDDDDDPIVDGTDPAATTPSSSTVEPHEPVSYSTSPYEVVISADTAVAWHGEPGTRVMIGGDGTIFRELPATEPSGWSADAPSVASAAAPTPPPPAGLTVAQISPEGMQLLFERAAELEMLDVPVPDYDSDRTPTDSGTALLTLSIEGTTFEHSLYAPQAPEDEFTTERARLAQFLDEVTDVESLVGDENISDAKPYMPDQWLVDEGLGEETSGPWPFETAPSKGCIAPPVRGDRDTVTGVYTDGGTVWVVEPALPWDDC